MTRDEAYVAIAQPLSTAIKASLTALYKRPAPWILSAPSQDATLQETYPELFG